LTATAGGRILRPIMPPLRAPALVFAVAVVAAPPLARAQQPPDSILLIAGTGVTLEQLAVWSHPPDDAARPVALGEAGGSKAGMLAVRVACAPGDFVVQTTSLVSLPFRLDPDWCGRTRNVTLVPAATVRGRVVPPVDSAQPAADSTASSGRAASLVSLPLRECAEEGAGRETGQLRVPVAADGRFSTVIPAGCVHVGLRLPPFSPIPPASLVLKPGETRDLGDVVLQRGATVGIGARYRGAPAPGVTVFVVPVDDYIDALDRLVSTRTQPGSLSGTTDRRGRVTFVGVQAASVRLIATAQDRIGLSGPITLEAGEETDVEDLELTGAATVTFTVVGDSSWIQDRLRVVGVAPSDGSDGAARSPVSIGYLTGTTSTAYSLLLPGRWTFELWAGEVRIDRQAVDVVPETTMTIQLSAERRRFRGRVFVGDEPVAGSLTLTTGDAGEVAARLDTGADGRFTAALPEPGRYTASFSRTEDGIQDTRAPVEFALDREAVIRFPPTRLEGTVVFADGRPAAGAVVELERSAESTDDEPPAAVKRLRSVTADRSGGFVVRSLEPGEYELTARLGGRKSDVQAVSTGDVDVPSVRLVLPDDDGLTLRLFDTRGESLPLVSGWVLAPATQQGRPPQVVPFQSDAEGTARIGVSRVPGNAVHVVITEPGRPITAFRAAPGDEGDLTLVVPPAGGQLRLSWPRVAAGADVGSLVLVGDGGAMVPLGLLVEIGLAGETSAKDATTVLIRALAPGDWHLGMFADSRAMLLALTAGAAPSSLRSFSVSPGAVVAVDLR
jgi:hypothetical protein